MKNLGIFCSIILVIFTIQLSNCVSPIPSGYPENIKAYLKTHPGATVTTTKTPQGGTKYVVSYTPPESDEYPAQVKAILAQHPDAKVIKTKTPDGKIKYEIKYPKKTVVQKITTSAFGGQGQMPTIIPIADNAAPAPVESVPVPEPQPQPVQAPKPVATKLKWSHRRLI